MAWASFPCQDLSLAGMGAGLKGHRSGTFWPFWNLIRDLHREGRQPEVVVLENVCGALTSHDGADFRSLIKALRIEGYRPGAMVIDASLFLPQSRPRLFIVGVRSEMEIDPSLISVGPVAPFHTPAVKTAHEALPKADRDAWIWWSLPVPSRRVSTFSSIIEDGLDWHRPEVTKALLAMMSPVNLAKITAAKKMGMKVVGAVYKRTRSDQDGIKAQRAEVRFDDIAGCLRTPGGGSSRQSIVVVQGSSVRSRLLSPREAARLMGLPDTYILPKNYNEAYRLMGDGVAVPVVRHLAHYLLEPLLTKIEKSISEAA
jgi:DNA (cytosine-5)-methyltransferase 1